MCSRRNYTKIAFAARFDSCRLAPASCWPNIFDFDDSESSFVMQAIDGGHAGDRWRRTAMLGPSNAIWLRKMIVHHIPSGRAPLESGVGARRPYVGVTIPTVGDFLIKSRCGEDLCHERGVR